MNTLLAFMAAPPPEPVTDNFGGFKISFLWLGLFTIGALLIGAVALKILMNGFGDQKIGKSLTKTAHVAIGAVLLVAATGVFVLAYAVFTSVKAS